MDYKEENDDDDLHMHEREHFEVEEHPMPRRVVFPNSRLDVSHTIHLSVVNLVIWSTWASTHYPWLLFGWDMMGTLESQWLQIGWLMVYLSVTISQPPTTKGFTTICRILIFIIHCLLLWQCMSRLSQFHFIFFHCTPCDERKRYWTCRLYESAIICPTDDTTKLTKIRL